MKLNLASFVINFNIFLIKKYILLLLKNNIFRILFSYKYFYSLMHFNNF